MAENRLDDKVANPPDPPRPTGPNDITMRPKPTHPDPDPGLTGPDDVTLIPKPNPPPPDTNDIITGSDSPLEAAGIGVPLPPPSLTIRDGNGQAGELPDDFFGGGSQGASGAIGGNGGTGPILLSDEDPTDAMGPSNNADFSYTLNWDIFSL